MVVISALTEHEIITDSVNYASLAEQAIKKAD